MCVSVTRVFWTQLQSTAKLRAFNLYASWDYRMCNVHIRFLHPYDLQGYVHLSVCSTQLQAMQITDL